MSLTITILLLLLIHAAIAEIWIWRLQHDDSDEEKWDDYMSRWDVYAVACGFALFSVSILLLDYFSGKNT